MSLSAEPSEISRRAVTTALAWSAPVVVLAVATPLAAASARMRSPIIAMDVLFASVGDSVPLVFTVTENGSDVSSGVLSVTLDGLDTVEFDPGAPGYSTSAVASAEITDGVAQPLVIVKGAGTITGSASYGSTSVSFATQVVVD